MKHCFSFAALFITCSSFIWNASFIKMHGCQSVTIIDFSVQRLSGSRVFISWHTEKENAGMQYEVMRKDRRVSQYFSVGVVKQNGQNSVTSIADYSYVDLNNNSDSSYYCLKKKTPDGVVFFSIPKGVEGVGKHHE